MKILLFSFKGLRVRKGGDYLVSLATSQPGLKQQRNSINRIFFEFFQSLCFLALKKHLYTTIKLLTVHRTVWGVCPKMNTSSSTVSVLYIYPQLV